MSNITIFILATIAMFVSAGYGYYMFERSVDGDLDKIATISMLESVACAIVMVLSR